MTFPAPCLPVHVPGCWAGRAQPHPGCALTGALCPSSHIRVEEGLLGTQANLLLPSWATEAQSGTCLTQGHTAGTPMALLPQALPLSHCAQLLSHAQHFATPWTLVRQTLLSMGILQARTLEWVAMPSSRRSSQPRVLTQVSPLQVDS